MRNTKIINVDLSVSYEENKRKLDDAYFGRGYCAFFEKRMKQVDETNNCNIEDIPKKWQTSPRAILLRQFRLIRLIHKN